MTDTSEKYVVWIGNTFDATDYEDAVLQMVAYLSDSAGSAGYRVSKLEDDGTEGTSVFVDADDIDQTSQGLQL